MKHSLLTFENEIINNILLSETCFEVAKSIPGLPGPGVYPFIYNLSYTKGVDILYSLLLYTGTNELSIKNYLSLYKKKNQNKDITKLLEKVDLIKNDLKNIAPFSIRNKIGSHFDADFTHKDFVQGYILPELLPNLLNITQQLKKSLFPFCKYSTNNFSGNIILGQVSKIVATLTKDFINKN
jgi:hypothetical protein